MSPLAKAYRLMIRFSRMSFFKTQHGKLNHRLPAFAAILVSVMMPSDGFGFPTCIFHHLLDIPCPACGLTRSMSSLLNFEWSKSLSYHPLGFIMLGYLGLCLFTNDPAYLRSQSFFPNQLSRVIFSPQFLVFLFLVVWVMRIT